LGLFCSSRRSGTIADGALSTGMSDQNHLARAWDVIEKVGICMLTTISDRGLRSRPLEARPARDGGCLHFVTDARGSKDDEIQADDHIGLVFIDAKEKVYLSLAGQAEVLRDSRLAAAIWRETDNVWWPQGPDDPNVRVIRFTPHLIEYWDGPASRAVAKFEFEKARATGRKPNLGENRKVTVTME
jgi:general stress protein 26